MVGLLILKCLGVHKDCHYQSEEIICEHHRSVAIARKSGDDVDMVRRMRRRKKNTYRAHIRFQRIEYVFVGSLEKCNDTSDLDAEINMFTNGVQIALWKNTSYVSRVPYSMTVAVPLLIYFVMKGTIVLEYKPSFLKDAVFFISMDAVE